MEEPYVGPRLVSVRPEWLRGEGTEVRELKNWRRGEWGGTQLP